MKTNEQYEIVWHGAKLSPSGEKGELLPPRLTPLSVGVLVPIIEDEEERPLL